MAAASDKRKTMGAAQSSSVAHRPSGMAANTGPPISSRPQYHSDMGVITTVGFTAFTRMPCGPSSSADTRVIASTAPLEEA